jgi:seryl-tRNA synthetase
VQKAIGQKFKAKEDASELLKEKEDIKARKANLADIEKEKEAAWKEKLKTIGNIVHASVPTSMDEVDFLIPRHITVAGS